MRENNEKLQRETDAAFALASVLLNLLLLLVVSGSIWLTYTMLAHTDTIGLVLRETAWR
jgi:hypothetical protein